MYIIAFRFSPRTLPRFAANSQRWNLGWRWAGDPLLIAAYMQAASRNLRIAGHEVGSGSGLHAAWLRSVRDMIAPLPGILQDAESDLQTAQSESDPHRLGEYARAAGAAEVAMNDGASAQDREQALVIMRSSLALIPGSPPSEFSTWSETSLPAEGPYPSH